MSYCIIVSETVMELEPDNCWRTENHWVCTETFYANSNVWFLREKMPYGSYYECLIILAFLSTICSSLVVSKASLRRLPSVKRFALRNVASIIKIDNIWFHRLLATIWMIPASFEHQTADHLCNTDNSSVVWKQPLMINVMLWLWSI